MKFRKIFIFFLCSSFLITTSACQKKKEENKKNVTDAINKDDYRMVIPFQSSDSRQIHVNYNRGEADINAIGKGLMNYNKDIFDPDTYYVQDGKILTLDTLGVGVEFGDKEGLLGFSSKQNSFGLNPKVGSKLEISDNKTINCGSQTIPIIDVFELDFYKSLDKKANFDGISFAIVLNNKIKDSKGKEHKIDKKYLEKIGENAVTKLEAYLNTLPDFNKNMEISVGLFAAESSDSSLPGHFLSFGHGKGKVSKYESCDQEWVVFPSKRAQKLDSVVWNEFNSFQQSIRNFLPNDVGVVGKGSFKDSKLDELQINIVAQTKGYPECTALVQYINETLSVFTNNDINIVVNVKNNNETFAMLNRKKGSNEITVIME